MRPDGIWWIFIAAHIPMPDFVGQPVSTVSTWAKQNQMESGVVAMAPAEYSMEYDKDIVIRQSVNPGRKVKTNTPITITVSNGPDPDEEIEFPNIYFMTQ
jgi:serine/threonine-protein kinase